MSNLKENKILKQYQASNNFGRLLEMDFELVQPGVIVYKLPVQEHLLATPVAAHGGAVASLVDASMGVACLSIVVSDNNVVSTVEFSIKYLNPVKHHDVLTAKAEVKKKGKNLMFAACDVFNQKGDLVALAQGTFNVYPSKKVFEVSK